MIITISGTPGSGKSTVAKILMKKLDAERIYVGGIRREMARDKGMSLQEFNKYAKTHKETDVDVDTKASEEAKELAKTKKVIAEGYTMFHFLPDSIKIFIKCELEVGARRIWKDLQQHDTKTARNEGKFTSFEQMKARVVERLEEDAGRYMKYYGIDHRDESQYDFVVDTSNISAEEAAMKVLEFAKKYK